MHMAKQVWRLSSGYLAHKTKNELLYCVVLTLHLQLHYPFQFGCKIFVHFCAMNTDVEIAPPKNCAEISPLYLT